MKDQRCTFCQEPAWGAVKTGVSAYSACKQCWLAWEHSDKTREVLEELRMLTHLRAGQRRLLKAVKGE